MSWKLEEFERSAYTIFEIIDENEETIKTFVADEKDYAEKKKKAQLIAAAPELLEAAELAKSRLETVIDELIETDYEYIYDGVTEMIRSDLKIAINKAKGADE